MVSSGFNTPFIVGGAGVKSADFNGIVDSDPPITIKLAAFGISRKGEARPITANWLSDDPNSVNLNPNTGKEVDVILNRYGEFEIHIQAENVKSHVEITLGDKGERKSWYVLSQKMQKNSIFKVSYQVFLMA